MGAQHAKEGSNVQRRGSEWESREDTFEQGKHPHGLESPPILTSNMSKES